MINLLKDLTIMMMTMLAGVDIRSVTENMTMITMKGEALMGVDSGIQGPQGQGSIKKIGVGPGMITVGKKLMTHVRTDQ